MTSLGDSVTQGLLSWAIERYRDKIASELKPMLSEIGEERILFLIDNNVSLWSVWPGKEELLIKLGPSLGPYADMIGRINLNDVAAELVKLIAEQVPDFAFIPQPWLLGTLREARREIVANVVK